MGQTISFLLNLSDVFLNKPVVILHIFDADPLVVGEDRSDRDSLEFDILLENNIPIA